MQLMSYSGDICKKCCKWILSPALDERGKIAKEFTIDSKLSPIRGRSITNKFTIDSKPPPIRIRGESFANEFTIDF